LMWRDLYPGRMETEVPIGHVTNGVHVPSWIHPRMATFYDRYLGQGWLTRLVRPSTWDGIYSADPFELWDSKSSIKRSFLGFVSKRLQARAERAGLSDLPTQLNPEALTIGYGRRFVEYKRPTLLFRDPDRLARLLSNPARPVQIVFAGKAHPNDEVGKILLRQIHEYTLDPRFRGKVFLLENYDMNSGRRLVQGCDLWLNTPRRPYEACGTSGQKALFNGTLNMSTLDGWWAEAYDRQNGYAFGGGLTHTDPTVQDQRDAADLLDVLEREVIPDFFERSPEGVPTRWIARILHAMGTLGARYNSDRMVMDYAKNCYLATAGAKTSDFSAEG
jgi:glycogen phosphorylase